MVGCLYILSLAIGGAQSTTPSCIVSFRHLLRSFSLPCRLFHHPRPLLHLHQGHPKSCLWAHVIFVTKKCVSQHFAVLLIPLKNGVYSSGYSSQSAADSMCKPLAYLQLCSTYSWYLVASFCWESPSLPVKSRLHSDSGPITCWQSGTTQQ